MLNWIKKKATKLILFIFWPIILWKSDSDLMEGKFIVFIGLISASAFIFSCFMKPSIVRFGLGFAGGILFYIGYLEKKIIMSEK